jgi:hypothetical protein
MAIVGTPSMDCQRIGDVERKERAAENGSH